ncbi:hypothetical protein Vadar_024702 [Vaccinium darrowii]|uniref:Uncharacterized protein n=1 Tax=Vaccinium darrowii TaxID=229202 RepID=A0ACB7Z7H5_9ERIC|nr:hypothetical protein Vadar_024702 [Vaccinium darrowii]
MVSPEWVPFESTISFRFHELREMGKSHKEDPSAVREGVRMGLVITGCDVFLVRTCEELESDWLKVLGDIQQKTILPVGLLPPSVQESTEERDDTWLEIGGWLDKQKKSSVVYVALGTEATPSQAQITELALGLELSGLAFFWTLRSRPGSSQSNSVELPNGFEERTKGRGMVWISWAPQLRILAHDAIGGFLTHCGWSSIIEGLQQGLPLIMLPMLWDQGLNARALAEKNVGVELFRNEQDGSFTRNSVAESLSLVMVEEEGRIYREKAREMSSIFKDRELQERYISTLPATSSDKDEKLDFTKPNLVACNAALEGGCRNLESVTNVESVVETMSILGVMPDELSFGAKFTRGNVSMGINGGWWWIDGGGGGGVWWMVVEWWWTLDVVLWWCGGGGGGRSVVVDIGRGVVVVDGGGRGVVVVVVVVVVEVVDWWWSIGGGSVR